MRLVLLEWARFINRCIWSWHGVVEIWWNEPSFRTWLLINFISAIAAVLMDLSGVERALVLSLGILILAMELMNSAIERAIDYISEDIHPLAKAAKDAASAAVAMCAFAAGTAWLVILVG